MKDNMLFTVLMTGTIDPGEYSDDISRNNIKTRISDYLQAIDFWLSIDDQRISGIVFCENSGFNLDCFRDKHGFSSRIPIEFISLNDNKKIEGMHYGFNELGIIDFALKNSNLLKASEYFIKSGRVYSPPLGALPFAAKRSEPYGISAPDTPQLAAGIFIQPVDCNFRKW